MFTLILPTYNEKENLKIFLPKLESLFKSSKIEYEILVVDDDSPDRTWEWVQEYSEKNKNVKVIRRITEKGLSSAVVTGMASAKGNYLGVMDADMQHDESILPKMIEQLKDKHLIIGSRRAADGSYGEMNWYRRFLSYGATLLAHIMLPIKTNDPMSGYFVMRKQVFEDSKNRINPRGYKILLEVLAKNPGISVGEVGYSFRRREFGETKLTGTVMQQYLIALLDLRFGNYISLTFLKYAFTGFLGIFVNLFGQWSFLFFSKSYSANALGGSLVFPSAAVAFGFELSVFFNFLLNNFWTFKEHSKKTFGARFFGLLKFNGVAILGFIIQYSTWFFFLKVFETNAPNFFPNHVTYLANLIGILFATASNYKLNKTFTWNTLDD